MRLTRRAILGGMLGSAATQVWAEAPTASRRPPPRGQGTPPPVVTAAEDLVRRAGLGGETSFAVADARTGQILEARQPLLPQPPASTAKTLTALYALDALGSDHRFATRLIATGPLVGGRLEGDLILAGGGDPVLDSDALGDMAARLKELGLREIAGQFKVWGGALPELRQIDPEQPPHVSYNPALSGLNLNFNRVRFGWKRQGSDYAVTMEARASRFTPGVTVARMEVADRGTPVYTYAERAGRDEWSVARRALGAEGARWLPVRRPAVYCGEAFRTLARAQGILLGNEGAEIAIADSLAGDPIIEHLSPRLDEIVADMLEYSTNPTAELIGLSASVARGGAVGTLKESAGRMDAWLADAYGAGSAALEDHSGLGDDSRIAAADMVRILSQTGPDSELRRLMKPYRADDGATLKVAAKTGTLNFVSALVGYISASDRTELVFAIYCADTDRRDALPMELRERPPGGRNWASAARGLQRALIGRWGQVYAA